ncbi:hypothetical protein GSI_10986 [Ganoderma sinense ZZ0214-1]|uniref:Uncharacterized protein n=1 Tax=Ganoderma sinense ZZ0214-1 TaxID=1077348 RepID=A0A2G8S253_9APHY|nr:hypothetical protein GSI_10986 [Ganoderma sinense ZZ0214-1]
MPATTPPAIAPLFDLFEEEAGSAVADDVDEEDEPVAELVPEDATLEEEDEARHEVSAPLTIENVEDTASTPVPYASTTYWPAVKLTFDHVHDAAAASTFVARVVPLPARFLKLVASVWGDALEMRRNWSVSWGPAYCQLSVADEHVLIVEGKFIHEKLGRMDGKVDPEVVEAVGPTVDKMDPGSVTDMLVAVEVGLDEGVVVDVSVCELELLIGSRERGKVGEERELRLDSI